MEFIDYSDEEDEEDGEDDQEDDQEALDVDDVDADEDDEAVRVVPAVVVPSVDQLASVLVADVGTGSAAPVAAMAAVMDESIAPRPASNKLDGTVRCASSRTQRELFSHRAVGVLWKLACV
jgi:hypothetical protein